MVLQALAGMAASATGAGRSAFRASTAWRTSRRKPRVLRADGGTPPGPVRRPRFTRSVNSWRYRLRRRLVVGSRFVTVGLPSPPDEPCLSLRRARRTACWQRHLRDPGPVRPRRSALERPEHQNLPIRLVESREHDVDAAAARRLPRSDSECSSAAASWRASMTDDCRGGALPWPTAGGPRSRGDSERSSRRRFGRAAPRTERRSSQVAPGTTRPACRSASCITSEGTPGP